MSSLKDCWYTYQLQNSTGDGEAELPCAKVLQGLVFTYQEIDATEINLPGVDLVGLVRV